MNSQAAGALQREKQTASAEILYAAGTGFPVGQGEARGNLQRITRVAAALLSGVRSPGAVHIMNRGARRHAARPPRQSRNTHYQPRMGQSHVTYCNRDEATFRRPPEM